MLFKELQEEVGKFSENYTENGAKGYKYSGSALVDFNFKVPSYRNNIAMAIDDFIKVWSENPEWALKYLFFARDIRGGLGERQLFRTLIGYLTNTEPELVIKVLPLIPEYGRWDDVVALIGSSVEKEAIELLRQQLRKDIVAMRNNEPISLCAKWMPSINTSSAETRNLAQTIIKQFQTTPCIYRKTLSKLRRYLDVVEQKTSSNRWADINYSSVPSKANLLYKDAFLRHDEERRTKWLEDVKKGKQHINASTLNPCEIVNQYFSDGWRLKPYNETIEQLWKALPNYVGEDSDTIVVADGSGSMLSPVGNCTALDVANSLAIYFSERAKGEFKDKYITFSKNPQLVDLSHCKSLRDKIKTARQYGEVANTNIYKVFDLLLTTAIKHNSPLPKNVLVISDMEFDEGADVDEVLFEKIKQEYKDAGLRLPRLVFWNVNSRTNTIPFTENEQGVALVSGYSASICKMVLSGELNPLNVILEQILSDRYKDICIN